MVYYNCILYYILPNSQSDRQTHRHATPGSTNRLYHLSAHYLIYIFSTTAQITKLPYLSISLEMHAHIHGYSININPFLHFLRIRRKKMYKKIFSYYWTGVRCRFAEVTKKLWQRPVLSPAWTIVFLSSQRLSEGLIFKMEAHNFL